MQISEPAEYAILGLLESQPMHGYEMFQQFQGGTLRQIVHLEMSQMYAFLKKLERLEYIEAELEPQGIRPPRKIFHLTDPGRAIFHEWLMTPVERPREIRWRGSRTAPGRESADPADAREPSGRAAEPAGAGDRAAPRAPP